MRYLLKGTSRDFAGNVIKTATISAFLAGTTTPASIYTAYSGGIAVNTVTSDTNGDFSFYVDDGDYIATQRFKITIAKTSYTTSTYDYISIFDISAAIDIDANLAANSDSKVASQKATKSYADTKTTLVAVKADSDVADAISKKHSRSHAVDSTSDHSMGSVSSGYLVKSDGTKLANATNTDSDVSDAVTKKHTQGTDTTLGVMTADVNMDTHKLTNLKVPSTAGDSIRATAKITEALLESATDLKHAQNTDTGTTGNSFAVGDGTAGSDKKFIAQNADANKPYLSYDEATNSWVFSNDGSIETKMAGAGAVTFAAAAEITTGTESAKAIAPDQLALSKYNGDWSFWGIKNLRLIDVHAGDATRVIVNPSAYNIPILIGEHWHVMTASVDVDSVDDLDTGSLAAGTDYYIYACTDGTTLSFKVSANSTNPAGFDAAHSRKIGGFHTLCVAVGTISGHPLTGYAQKDILPASIWDLKHRAKNLVNVGLVYDSKIQKWVDIYLASGTGANTTSVNGGTISDGRNWMDFVDDGLAVGKRLLTDTEFTSAAAGSNEETNISGSSDPGTTGGHVDTAGRRMISNIGCEDCCGVVWQWIQDQSYYYYGATGYYGNLPGGKGSTYTNFAADPGASEVDNSDTGGDTKLVAGGNWGHAASAGSRSRYTGNSRWHVYSHLGARFAVEPL